MIETKFLCFQFGKHAIDKAHVVAMRPCYLYLPMCINSCPFYIFLFHTHFFLSITRGCRHPKHNPENKQFIGNYIQTPAWQRKLDFPKLRPPKMPLISASKPDSQNERNSAVHLINTSPKPATRSKTSGHCFFGPRTHYTKS